jgi:hypothetical protein
MNDERMAIGGLAPEEPRVAVRAAIEFSTFGHEGCSFCRVAESEPRAGSACGISFAKLRRSCDAIGRWPGFERTAHCGPQRAMRRAYKSSAPKRAEFLDNSRRPAKGAR